MVAIAKPSNGTQSGGAGSSLTLSSLLLFYYSSVLGLLPNGDISYSKIQYTIASYPSSGIVSLAGTKLKVGDTFTQADINSSRVSYTNDGKNTTPIDNIGVSIKDLNDPLAAAVSGTIKIKINLPEMPPSGKTIGITVKQAETKFITRSNLDFDDFNNPGAYDDIKFVLTSVPLYGDLYIDGKKVIGLTKADGVTPWTFTQEQLNNSAIFKYTSVPTYPDALLANSDSFTFYAVDPKGNKTTDIKFPINIQLVSEPMSIDRNGPLIVKQNETKGVGPEVLYVSDPDTPAGSLVFTVKGLPTHGKMFKNVSGVWTEFTLTTTFTQTDVNNGNLKYTNDGSENTNDSFTYSVSDSVNNSPDTVFPISVTVIINKPPVLTITPLSVFQAAIGIIDDKVIQITDPEGVSNDLLSITVKTLPLKGTLFLNSVLVTKDQVIQYSDILSGKFTYKHNGIAAPETDSFDIVASDSVKFTASTTIPINVLKSPNKPPYLVNNPATNCPNGGKVVMGSVSLLWADDDDAPVDVVMTITELPLYGTISEYDGTVETPFIVGTKMPLSRWQTLIAVPNIGLRYSNTTLFPTAQTDKFSFTLSDAHGNTVGPFDHIINIGAPTPNNPPVLINNGKNQIVSTSDTIKPTELSASDSDNTDLELIFTVTELPTKGDLYVAGIKAAVGTKFTVADIKALRLRYTNVDFNAKTDMFAFTLTDGTSVIAGVMSIYIQGNLSLDLTELTVLEGNSAEINETIMKSISPSCSPNQINYQIDVPPQWGTIKKNNTPVTSFTQEEVNAGLVRYFQDVPLPPTTDDFVFTVTDCLGSFLTKTLNINIILADGAPKVVTSMLTVYEKNCSTIPNDNLRIVDTDTTSDNLIVTITSPVSYIGTIRVNGLDLLGGATFPYSDIEDGNVLFCAPNINQAEYITDFVFSVSDGFNYVPGLLKIKILDVPSPELVNYGMQVTPCSSTTITTSMLNITGIGSETLDTNVIFTISELPSRCSIRLNDTAMAIGGSFTLQDIKTGKVKVVSNSTDVILDSFKFSWTITGSMDVYGNPFGGLGTFYIDVYYVNNPPWVCVLNDISLMENSTVTIDINHLAMCDVDLDDTPVILPEMQDINISNLGGLLGHIEARKVDPGKTYKWELTTGVEASASFSILSMSKTTIYQSSCVGQNTTRTGTFTVPLDTNTVYVSVTPSCSALFPSVLWTFKILS